MTAYKLIYKDKPSRDKSWQFKIASLHQIDWKKLGEDLSYKFPIAFIELPNNLMYVAVHVSLIEKAKAIHIGIPEPLRTESLIPDVKTQGCRVEHRSFWIEWAKNVKAAEWPEEEISGIVKVIVPKI